MFLFSLVVELPPLTLNQLAKDCDVKVLKPKKELLIAVHIHNEQIAYIWIIDSVLTENKEKVTRQTLACQVAVLRGRRGKFRGHARG